MYLASEKENDKCMDKDGSEEYAYQWFSGPHYTGDRSYGPFDAFDKDFYKNAKKRIFAEFKEEYSKWFKNCKK